MRRPEAGGTPAMRSPEAYGPPAMSCGGAGAHLQRALPFPGEEEGNEGGPAVETGARSWRGGVTPHGRLTGGRLEGHDRNPTKLPDELFRAACRRDAEAMARWARGASPEDLHQVLEAVRADPWCALAARGMLLKAMARHGRTIPPSLLQFCVNDQALLPVLALNRALTTRQAKVLAQHLPGLLGRPEWSLECLVRVVKGIFREELAMGDEVLAELVRIAGEARRGDHASHYHLRIPVDVRRADRAVRVLAEIPHLESELLAELIHTATIPEELVERFIATHANADRRVWLAALSCPWEPFPARAPGILARHPRASGDAQVRERLRSGEWEEGAEVLYQLLLRPLDDTEELLDRLFAVDALKVARLMTQGPEEVRAAITQDRVVKLLAHPSGEVRIEAFRGLG